ncbi:dTDP-4-dehydrorhamnose 3,5-epimerase [Actinophytocola sp.]|uniref:dTDP-4-dehydrorhamnose 3,5-epimerase family protein n=1 Tax=Actinophytocola sp. TaxID=1872138 RepID=UPI002EDAB170
MTSSLAVPDAYEFAPRGGSPFHQDSFTAARGHPLTVARVDHEVSRPGTVRGIHFTTPPGRARYVYCVRGAVLAIVVDLRVGSPAFGRWDAVRLDAVTRRAVYLAEGLGRAFVALADDTATTHLCTESDAAEHGVDPLDPALALPWPAARPSTRELPTLAQAAAADLLPHYTDCLRRYRLSGVPA